MVGKDGRIAWIGPVKEAAANLGPVVAASTPAAQPTDSIASSAGERSQKLDVLRQELSSIEEALRAVGLGAADRAELEREATRLRGEIEALSKE